MEIPVVIELEKGAQILQNFRSHMVDNKHTETFPGVCAPLK